MAPRLTVEPPRTAKIGDRSRKLKNLAASTGSSGVRSMKPSPSINMLRPYPPNSHTTETTKAN